MRYISKSEKDTQKVAKKLARKLQGGEVIALIGELGAGKTTLVRGLAKSFGIYEPVRSPTFVLMRCYPIKTQKIKKLCHIDSYRLKSAGELFDIGILEYLGQKNTVVIIEWAEKVKEIWENQVKKIVVEIHHGKKENERIIVIQQLGTLLPPK